MRRIRADIGRMELAAIVADTLRAHDVDAVLVGGSVVAFYSNGKYVTDDLDFVSHKPLKTIAPLMERLGFQMNGNTAVHPATKLYVQFCAPPLAIGRQPVVSVALETAHGTVETLAPTDCVLDRLMHYYHWNDEQALEQALLVARSQKIDLRRIRDVSKSEGKLEAFEQFRARLRK
jgi:hypothetical protein